MSVFLLEHFWGPLSTTLSLRVTVQETFLMSFPGSVDGVKRVRKEEEGRGEESSILPRWLTLFPSYTDSCFKIFGSADWAVPISCRDCFSAQKVKIFSKGVLLKIWAFLKILYNYRLTKTFKICLMSLPSFTILPLSYMANNVTLMRKQIINKLQTPGNTVHSIPHYKQNIVQLQLWDRTCFLFVKMLLGKCYMLYIFLCLYPWSSYFLSFQTNHWSLLDINKTSSKQHHLGAQIINELWDAVRGKAI